MLTTGEIDVSQLQGYCLHVVLFYRFILVDIGEAGRHSDGGVLSNSLFGQALEEGSLSIPEPSPLPGIIHNIYVIMHLCQLQELLYLTSIGTSQPHLPYVIVGDEAFLLRENMMRPYPGRNLPGK